MDYRDYESYELSLDMFFNMYDITDMDSFEAEMQNGDIINNLAYSIAMRSGFTGTMSGLINNHELNNEVNTLAANFLRQFAIEVL